MRLCIAHIFLRLGLTVGIVAQLVEHITFNDGVVGSNPASPTKYEIKMETEKEQVHVAVFCCDGKYYLLLTNNNGIFNIQGWTNKPEALAYFTRGYNQFHDRGYESSMSACINYIQFQPTILSFDNLQDMIQKLGLKEGSQPVRLSSISGYYVALPLDTEMAKQFYDQGTRPALITQD